MRSQAPPPPPLPAVLRSTPLTTTNKNNKNSSIPKSKNPNIISHAVDRSSELLSCARTALKIAQRQHERYTKALEEDSTGLSKSITVPAADQILPLELRSVDPSILTLHVTIADDDDEGGEELNPAKEALEDISTSLTKLDTTLLQLSTLVRRRTRISTGQQDPTEEIQRATTEFHFYTKEIVDLLGTYLPEYSRLPVRVREVNKIGVNGIASNSKDGSDDDGIITRKPTKQRMKHYEMVTTLLRSNLEERGKSFKKVMEVRGDVLKDVTLRRKQIFQNAKGVGGESGGGRNGKDGDDKFTSPSAPGTSNYSTTTSATSSTTSTSTTTTIDQFNSQAVAKKKNVVLPKPPPAPPSLPSYLNSSNRPSSSIGAPSPLLNNPLLTSNGSNNKSSMNGQYSKPSSTSNTIQQPSKQMTNGYGGKSQNVGYGGYNHNNPYSATNTGMRHRTTGGNNTTTTTTTSNNTSYNPYGPQTTQQPQNDELDVEENDDKYYKQKIDQRRRDRNTKSRVQDAQQAESKLAELTTMFSKMSTLIQSQGETLVKIEDDVEVAMGYVEEGGEEIVKLWDMKRGNRGLIVKVFGILIFMIVFMKWYG